MPSGLGQYGPGAVFESGSGEDVVLTDPGTLGPLGPFRQHAVIRTGHHTLYLGGGLLLQLQAPAVTHKRLSRSKYNKM